MTDKFPNARFGDRPWVNWRDLPEIEDDDPDDEQIETPEDVIEMLGFDPAEDDELAEDEFLDDTVDEDEEDIDDTIK
jgi:hypothetical protein